jgi:hypothetical protein
MNDSLSGAVTSAAVYEPARYLNSSIYKHLLAWYQTMSVITGVQPPRIPSSEPVLTARGMEDLRERRRERLSDPWYADLLHDVSVDVYGHLTTANSASLRELTNRVRALEASHTGAS